MHIVLFIFHSFTIDINILVFSGVFCILYECFCSLTLLSALSECSCWNKCVRSVDANIICLVLQASASDNEKCILEVGNYICEVLFAVL